MRAAIVFGTLLFVACATRTEPTRLEFPAKPPLTFARQGDVCLSLQDADKLDKWFDQIAAFNAAWTRLRPTR